MKQSCSFKSGCAHYVYIFHLAVFSFNGIIDILNLAFVRQRNNRSLVHSFHFGTVQCTYRYFFLSRQTKENGVFLGAYQA
jgi:hypothetical protein